VTRNGVFTVGLGTIGEASIDTPQLTGAKQRLPVAQPSGRPSYSTDYTVCLLD